MSHTQQINNLSINISQSANMRGVMTSSALNMGSTVVVGSSQYQVHRIESVKILYFPASGRVTLQGATGTRHIDQNKSTFLTYIGYMDRQALINEYFSQGVPICIRMETTVYLNVFDIDFRLAQ